MTYWKLSFFTPWKHPRRSVFCVGMFWTAGSKPYLPRHRTSLPCFLITGLFQHVDLPGHLLAMGSYRQDPGMPITGERHGEKMRGSPLPRTLETMVAEEFVYENGLDFCHHEISYTDYWFYLDASMGSRASGPMLHRRSSSSYSGDPRFGRRAWHSEIVQLASWMSR